MMDKRTLNALFAGSVSGLMLIAAQHFPILLSPLTVLIPTPILIAAVQGGVRGGLIALGVLLIAAYVEVPTLYYPLLILLFFGLFPVLAGVMVRTGWRAVHCGAAAFVLGAVLLLGVFLLALVTGTDLHAILSTQMDTVLTEIMIGARSNGSLDAQQLVALQNELEQSFSLAALLFLGLTFTGWFLIQTINLLAARLVAVRLNDPIYPRELFGEWRTPDLLVWLLIGFSLVGLLTDGALHYLGVNMAFYITAPYSFQGLAVVQSAFRAYRIGAFFQGVFYALLFIWMDFALLFVTAIGLSDTWVDFRKRFLNAPDGQSAGR